MNIEQTAQLSQDLDRIQRVRSNLCIDRAAAIARFEARDLDMKQQIVALEAAMKRIEKELGI